ncbi:MAG: hypothetical protein A2539_05880 [Elusimicrobia bacterium RIFOXYD2_FULL_34_15]|nr:MAG: hypothetical protein A2539_05880 [Elusimicrobia bacterium RIFOXYD2_FULL_34_15]
MISKEVIKAVKRIEIKTGRLVNDIFAGRYESVFKGRGMEFSEVREYLPGDDIRSIDWNVTARYGHPFVKKFTEERELTIILLVDASASGHFGTIEKMKFEIAAEISSVIAFSALKNNDKVGLLIFTDEIEMFIPPKKSRTHILRMVREILFFKPKKNKTNISMALKYLNDVARKKAIVFLISDFIDKNYEKDLRIINKRHDLITIKITDPKEKYLPKVGLLDLQDMENGETFTLDTNDEVFRNAFFEYQSKREKSLDEFFKKSGIDNIKISTDKSYIEPLIAFFERRSRRFR